MRCLLFLWSDAALSRLDVGFFILRGCLNKNKASLFYVFLLYSANINRGFRRGFLRTENRKRILPHKRTDFVTFALRRSDCSLAGSFLSEAVLSGRTERLTQGNKTVLLCGKIPFPVFVCLSNTLPFILSEEPTLFLEDSIFGNCDFLSCFLGASYGFIEFFVAFFFPLFLFYH